MDKTGCTPIIVAGVFVVAFLATLIAQGGWVLWIPTLAALATVSVVSTKLSR
jgi:hypothetical protein